MPPSPKNEPDFGTAHSPAPFIIPLIVFLVLGMFAPSFDDAPNTENSDQTAEQLAEVVAYTSQRNTDKAFQYTLLVAAQVVIGCGLIFFFHKTYLHQFPLRASFWSLLVGVLGVVLWISICRLGLEHAILNSIGKGEWLPKRVGFDPTQIQSDSGYYLFLGFRFLLLAALVPIIEELFLRGWLIRYIDNEDWWKITLASVSLKACGAATLYGIVAHPGECFAAAVWFSLVTFMMKRTGNFWDCVIAHIVTNLLLGIWIIYTSAWFLW